MCGCFRVLTESKVAKENNNKGFSDVKTLTVCRAAIVIKNVFLMTRLVTLL